jgi:hypothetical protein
VNTNGLAKHYGALTVEERFRLIMAAIGRGDDAEKDRLAYAARRTLFSVADYGPLARAFGELALLTYIDLLARAADYLECLEWTLDNPPPDRDGNEAEGDTAEAGPPGTSGGRPEGGAASAGGTDAGPERDADRAPTGQRARDLALLSGYEVKAKFDGWNLFCERWNVPPYLATWELLPGFDRLQDALELAGEAGVSRERFWECLSGQRPAAGELKLPDTGVMSPEACADFLEARFRWLAQPLASRPGRQR